MVTGHQASDGAGWLLSLRAPLGGAPVGWLIVAAGAKGRGIIARTGLERMKVRLHFSEQSDKLGIRKSGTGSQARPCR